MGWIDCSVATGVPDASTWPNSTCLMETRPSKGARMGFLAMVAWRGPTFAAVCFAFASADRDACHSWASTLAEVTDPGGIANDLLALIILAIWPPLMAPKTPTTATSATAAMTHTRHLLGRVRN